MELWKDIKGFEGLYKVSNMGNVISVQRHGFGKKINERKLKNIPSKTGYIVVHLYKDKKSYAVNMHRLVGEHFLENIHGYRYINHINAVRHDNNYFNLEWCTPSHNLLHCYKLGRMPTPRPKGASSKYSKAVIMYKEDGSFYREFPSLRDVSKFFGKEHIGNVSTVVNGKRKTLYGYKLKFAS